MRLTAIALTIGVALFILVSFALILTGPTLATELAQNWGLGPVVRVDVEDPPVAGHLRDGSASASRSSTTSRPMSKQEWIWLTPGSVLATTLWLLASLGFKYYVANWGDYTETYGLIGAVMILLLWFYISGLVILDRRRDEREIEHAGMAGPRRRIGDRTFAGVERRQHAQ